MNETRKYLEHHAQETADAITGEIIERTPDGTYRYRDIRTGAERFATANLGDDFSPGSRVRIDMVSASRGTIGSQDTILTRAPREQRGLSATTPAEERVGAGRTVILSVSPDPLIIHAGGDPGEQTFTGIGFESQPATYVSSYVGGPDPVVTDDSAPVVSDTSVAMSIAADVDSPRGDFDAIVNGARARKALRILRPPPFAPEWGLFVLVDSASNELVSVAFVAGAGPWTTVPHVIWSRSGYLGGTVLRLVQVDADIFVVFFVGGGARRVYFTPSTGVFTMDAAGTHPEPWSVYAQFAAPAGSWIYYGTADNRFLEVHQQTGAVNRTLLAASSLPYRGAHYHAGTASLFTANALNVGGSIKIQKIDSSTGMVTTANLVFEPSTPDVITSNGDDLLVYFRDGNSSGGLDSNIRKLSASTLGSGATSSDLEPSSMPTGFAFYSESGVRIPIRTDVTGASAKRKLVSVQQPFAGGFSANEADGFEGCGAVLVPEPEGPWGYPYLWRLMRVSSGTASIVIRGLAMLGSGGMSGAINIAIPSSDLAPGSADLGLGWTAL